MSRAKQDCVSKMMNHMMSRFPLISRFPQCRWTPLHHVAPLATKLDPKGDMGTTLADPTEKEATKVCQVLQMKQTYRGFIFSLPDILTMQNRHGVDVGSLNFGILNYPNSDHRHVPSSNCQKKPWFILSRISEKSPNHPFY